MTTPAAPFASIAMRSRQAATKGGGEAIVDSGADIGAMDAPPVEDVEPAAEEAPAELAAPAAAEAGEEASA